VDGVITSSFGTRINPELGVREFHEGVDIAVPEKTKAVAVCDGVVTYVGTSPTYGNYIKFTSSDGRYEIMYAHLSSVTVKVGKKIKQGDVVALTGSTGLSTGPHLHYSLWIDGVLSDPMPFLHGLTHTSDVSAEYAARGEVCP